MTPVAALLAFTVAAGLLTITPGLDTALVLRTAASEGPRRAFLAGLGIAGGCLAWGVIVAFGLGALLAASELAYTVLRWIGAAYLVYLGIGMIRHARGRPPGIDPGATGDTAAPASGLRWLGRGFLTNILNPKVGAFYVTFLPQFIPAGAGIVGFTMLLAGLHAALGVLWFAALILATRPLLVLFRRPAVTRALDRVTGSVLILFGLRLAFEQRR